MNLKNIIKTFLFIISLPLFIFLDNGFKITDLSQLLQPVLFSITLILSIQFHKTRKSLLTISLILFILLIIIYLFGFIDASNWVGSLGFGMLFIILSSYLPEIIKKGLVERF